MLERRLDALDPELPVDRPRRLHIRKPRGNELVRREAIELSASQRSQRPGENGSKTRATTGTTMASGCCDVTIWKAAVVPSSRGAAGDPGLSYRLGLTSWQWPREGAPFEFADHQTDGGR